MKAERELTKKEKRHVARTMKYNREKTKSFTLRFQVNKDKDIIEYLQNQKNKTDLVRTLIREQMIKEWYKSRKKKGNK